MTTTDFGAQLGVSENPLIPVVGEVFELTLEPIASLDMIGADGYDPTGWRFVGKEITEPCSALFELTKVGYQPDLAHVRRELLSQYGDVPAGQWREALKTHFRYDGQGMIGVADPSWVGPDGCSYFPFYGNRPGFDWTGTNHAGYWRWLVPHNK